MMETSVSGLLRPLVPWLASHGVLALLLWARLRPWRPPPREAPGKRAVGPVHASRALLAGRALGLAIGVGFLFQCAGSFRTTPSPGGDLLNALAMLPLLTLSLLYLAALVLALRRLRLPLAGTLGLLLYLPALLLSLAGTLGFGPAADAFWALLLPPAAFMMDAHAWLQGARSPAALSGLRHYLLHLVFLAAVALTPTMRRAPRGQGAPP